MTPLPTQKFSTFSRFWVRSVGLACLLVLGLLSRAAWADGTPAGTEINNRATASYDDPDGSSITTTSNTVTLTVAEVAGITSVANGFTDSNGGSVATGDGLDFLFTITNVGNAPTQLHLPGATHITTQGLDSSGLTVLADLDNNGSYETTIPASGFTTTTPIAPGGVIRVKVTGTVTATSLGSPVSVRLGNTGSNDNGAGTQNQPDNGGGADPLLASDEIYTVDFDNTTAPANGTREAAALNATTLGGVNTSQALAVVLKSIALYTPQTAIATDDLITYRLDLRVSDTAPPGSGITAGTLEGTAITISDGGGSVNRILVTDVIPVGTTFDANFTPLTPVGWQVIYSTTPIAGSNALTATWTIAQPAAASITRIGFVLDGTLPPGNTTTTDRNGFQFRVITAGLTASGGTVSNVAQSFGETLGDANNRLIYDESGDQQPNNFNPDNTVGPAFNPTLDTGVPKTGVGSDPGNNAGTGVGGDKLDVKIGGVAAILNGPSGQPAAIGTTNNQDDFLNKAAVDLPPGNAGAYNPNPVEFTNTLQNPPGNAGDLSNIVIRPIAPTQAIAAASGNFGANSDLPVGTIVQIQLGNQSATYTFDGTTFNLTSGTPVTIPTLALGATQNYTVRLDLPDGTPQVQGFAIPIAAFVDNGDQQFNPGDDPNFNLTVNRFYTGFVKVLKEARILAADNNTELEGFTATPTVKAARNQIIEYRITYTNISTPSAAGSGSTVLNAADVQLLENGIAAPNNWANFTNHVPGSATDALGTITYFVNDAAFNADPGAAVTAYQDKLNGVLAPGASGNFRFRRQVK